MLLLLAKKRDQKNSLALIITRVFEEKEERGKCQRLFVIFDLVL
jgi:hypothetical protein